MSIREIVSYRDQLETLIERGRTLHNDEELQAQWAKYLCVLTSGYLEMSVQSLLGHYAANSASPRIATFVSSQLKGFQNAKMEKILEIVGSFDRNWADELRKQTDDDIKAAVDSIVSNRHLIAHGRSTSISYARIKDYHKRAIQVVTLIAEKCGVTL